MRWFFCIFFGIISISFFTWRYCEHLRIIESGTLYEKFEEKLQKCQLDAQVDNVCIQSLSVLAQDIKKRVKTPYATMSALRFASFLYEKHMTNEAKLELQWILSYDPGTPWKYLAKLHLANIFLEEKSFDLALEQLSDDKTSEFRMLFLDKRGDIYFAQDKYEEARKAYQDALISMDAASSYRLFIALKLKALGAVPNNY